jgi:rubredoxin
MTRFQVSVICVKKGWLMMKKLKCYACDGIFDENKLIYCKDPDELMCPLCHAREDGFSEVEEGDKE